MNTSVLDRNICHAFEAYGAVAFVAEDAFWRFRDSHESLCAERLADLAATSFTLTEIATRVCLPMLPADVRQEPEQAWRVRIELDQFMRERLHHADGMCICAQQERNGR